MAPPARVGQGGDHGYRVVLRNAEPKAGLSQPTVAVPVGRRGQTTPRTVAQSGVAWLVLTA